GAARPGRCTDLNASTRLHLAQDAPGHGPSHSPPVRPGAASLPIHEPRSTPNARSAAHPRRRRPGRRARGASPAPQGRRLRRRDGELAECGARAPRAPRLRRDAARHELHPRYDLRPRRARPARHAPDPRAQHAGRRHDGVEKPWDNARLVSILTTQVELGRALQRAQRLETENKLLRRDHLPRMIAESPRMQPVLQLMERVGPSDANVLITGEHGTGKELVAQWLHASSARKARSFIAVNMGGLSEGLFESELFGHVKGSFTDAKTDRVGRFELADGGTLFLDEIGTVPLSLQSKLLRVLQTGDVERVGSAKARHVDVRIISATNANLPQ